MAQLTIKQFKYFEALAREGHFGRAANSCAINITTRTFNAD